MGNRQKTITGKTDNLRDINITFGVRRDAPELPLYPVMHSVMHCEDSTEFLGDPDPEKPGMPAKLSDVYTPAEIAILKPLLLKGYKALKTNNAVTD